MKKILIGISACLILFASVISAQDNTPQKVADVDAHKRTFTQILGGYIDIALANNLDIALLKRNAEESNEDRKVALSEFFPKLSFQSRYSTAGGGRKIIIDVNQFVGGLFPGMQFPVMEESFLRPHEQETKFNATQVLFAGGAVLNAYNAKSSLYEASLGNLETAKWNKRLETAEAYLNFLKASELVKIRERVLELAKEGLSITESLYRQDKLLKSDVMRAGVNVSKAESELIEAQEHKRMGQRFFNNLLNRDVFTEIEESPVSYSEAVEMDIFKAKMENAMTEVTSLESTALARRKEIESLNHSLEAISKIKNIAFSDYLPKVILSVDYGWQGEEYSFNSESDYYMASLVFQINLFDGLGREARLEKAVIQEKKLEIQKLIAMKNIGLQVEQAYLKLQTARKQIKVAEEQFVSAEENYRIVQKRYSVGMALSLDMNDALAEFDIASSTRVIALYDYIAAIETMKNVLGNENKEYSND